jgi:hypothetical protein
MDEFYSSSDFISVKNLRERELDGAGAMHGTKDKYTLFW